MPLRIVNILRNQAYVVNFDISPTHTTNSSDLPLLHSLLLNNINDHPIMFRPNPINNYISLSNVHNIDDELIFFANMIPQSKNRHAGMMETTMILLLGEKLLIGVNLLIIG